MLKKRIQIGLTLSFVVSMGLVAALRYAAHDPAAAPFLIGLSTYATPLYIGATVLFAVLLARAGVNFSRMGFARRIRITDVTLAIVGIVFLQATSTMFAGWWEALFGVQRDLSRFEGVQGSVEALIPLLIFNWTFAAFGEEIAFRIVMMRAIAAIFGDGVAATFSAVIGQAIVFGLLHLYQGPAGAAGAATSGLVFGLLTVAARGAIWPAAIAHGGNNTVGLMGLYLGS
ncbi:MAG: CPBP family intramembrane glutamic endopeptidase [Pseudomonadota bacterium]